MRCSALIALTLDDQKEKQKTLLSKNWNSTHPLSLTLINTVTLLFNNLLAIAEYYYFTCALSDLTSANIIFRVGAVPEFGDMLENIPPNLKSKPFIEPHHPSDLGSISLLREETIRIDFE